MPTRSPEEYNATMSNPHRGSHIHPPPIGDPILALDVTELEDVMPSNTIQTVGMGLDADGTRSGSAMTSGAMRRRPGIDDEDEHDTEPDGWRIPDWD